MNKKICPKCGSADVKSQPAPFEVSTGVVLNNFSCNKCDYEGPMAEEEKK
jgi:hypothetical protein